MENPVTPTTKFDRSAFFGLALLMSLGFASPVLAAPLTAEQTLNQFNLVVLGDATSRSHVDGRSFSVESWSVATMRSIHQTPRHQATPA